MSHAKTGPKFFVIVIVALRVHSPAARSYQAVRRITGRTDKYGVSVPKEH